MLSRTCVLVLAVCSIANAFQQYRTAVRIASALNANLLETAKQAGNFKTLIAAVESIGLTEVLNGDGPYTLFAPNDEAFKRMDQGQLAALMGDKTALGDLLLFHVHPGKLFPTRSGRTFNTLLIDEDTFPKQCTVKVTYHLEQYIVTGQPNHAKILKESIKCDNGLIHEMSEVMIPYEGTQPPKITAIGARDLEGKAQLQTGYYGSEAGKGRHGEVLGNTDEKFDPSKNSILGDEWRKSGNYDNGATDGGVAGQGYSTNERGGDLAAFYKKQYAGNIAKDREVWLGGEFTKKQEDVLKKAPKE
jgi:uncharacterized surface protein with fasciclin (FAS1) repeats